MCASTSFLVESFIAGTLYLNLMRILAGFSHANGDCTEVILVVLYCFLHDLLFLCFYFFSVYHSGMIHHVLQNS